MKCINAWIRKCCIYLLDKFDDSTCYDESTIEIGDVVWSKMPLTKEQMLRIPPGHRIRPFVIVEVMKEGCIGYACSSTPWQYSAPSMQFRIDKDRYDIQKSSYADMSKKWELSYSLIQSHYCHLQEDDLLSLLEMSKHKQQHHVMNEIGVGSIIRFEHQLYVVYEAYKEHLYAHVMLEKKLQHAHSYQPFSFNKQLYYIDFSIRFDVSHWQQVEILYHLSKIQRDELKRKSTEIRQKEEARKKKQKTIDQLQLQFPIGAMFYVAYENVFFIYLYHLEHRAYGCYLERNQNEEYVLRKINMSFIENYYEICAPKQMEMIFDHILAVPEHQVLLEHIKKRYETQMAQAKHPIGYHVQNEESVVWN